MHVRLADKPLQKIDADITVELLTAAMLKKHPYRKTLEKAGFKASQDQLCPLYDKDVVVAGIANQSAGSLRSAAASVAKSLSSSNYTSLKLSHFGTKSLSALVEGFVLGSYSFDQYKSDPSRNTLDTLYCSTTDIRGKRYDKKKLQAQLDDAVVICNATNFTRTLVNTTPQDMTPEALSLVALELAETNGMECTVLDEGALAVENMNAMLSVGRASVNKPRLIHLAYKPNKPKRTISLVGKGLTYDSGGLSLKPSTSMVTMKMDKAGACAVLGMMKAISELKLDVEVHGFVGAAENMVDGSAYKPDDVLKARNGKTIEVRNTDAEGRLVLADVLCYAQDKVKSDYLFDFATLTGACMVALGPYTTGIMGHNTALKQQINDAAEESGELVGPLPFNDHLKKLIKSEIADVCNIGSKPYGGAITAALFLDQFITDKMKDKWMHFDIAGPAYTESPWDCHGYGGTGAGVRMTTQFIKMLGK
jgi:leucyl aminopeptidase